MSNGGYVMAEVIRTIGIIFLVIGIFLLINGLLLVILGDVMYG